MNAVVSQKFRRHEQEIAVAQRNEEITRSRLAHVERALLASEPLILRGVGAHAVIVRGFWGRLRWLLLGR